MRILSNRVYLVVIGMTLLGLFVSANENGSVPTAEWMVNINGIASTEGTIPFGLDSGLSGFSNPNTFIPGFGVSMLLPLAYSGANIEFSFKAYQSFLDEKPFLVLPLAYVRALFFGFELAAGKYPISEGLNPRGLSSGSLILNGEGPAYPVLYIGTQDFIVLPYTRGIFETRFSFSYGVLDDDRFIKEPLIHTKSLYGKVNLPFGLFFIGGLVHAVTWGGTSPIYGELPSGWDSFINAILADNAGESAPDGEQINAEGDHKGMWDYALGIKNSDFSLLAYYQHFFEDGSGKEYRNDGWLDGLFGLALQSVKPRLISGICYEYYNSTNQSGTGVHNVTGGMDYYYENYIYNTGWIYDGSFLGSRFIITKGDGISVDYLHTRARVHIVALKGFISPMDSYRFNASFARYYGTYSDYNNATGEGNDIFENGLPQTSLSLFVRHLELFKIKGLYGEIGIGFDIGEARSDSFGLRFAVGYTGII